MNESHLPATDVVIERALQGYAPEDLQQASALVTCLQSVLPLDDGERPADAADEVPAGAKMAGS